MAGAMQYVTSTPALPVLSFQPSHPGQQLSKRPSTKPMCFRLVTGPCSAILARGRGMSKAFSLCLL